MGSDDFEGTRVLEALAAIDKVDAFLEAVDEDDAAAAARWMKLAGLDAETIAVVLRKMADADGEH